MDENGDQISLKISKLVDFDQSKEQIISIASV